eukprot:TRINITY_DN24223_c0_g1_i1.p1 TRINITY_DN24223_c0_g1~~TRINITY_DN24223_c0_g1_i1.p1  ORF type:complete len:345 (-),score=60.51 TRINITY_DN24223_c0_g1_i1:183-1217(-)
MESILVAACDLDKTLYPPAGPEHQSQLKANLKAMTDFESTGGFVFPVTGNNLLLAQRKMMDPADPSSMLRELRINPGIYTNGGLVLGPNGKQLEKHALGKLQIISESAADSVDFVSAFLDFVDTERGDLLKGVGVAVLTPERVAGYDAACSNVDGYAQSMNISAEGMSREELIKAKDEVLQIVLLFPKLLAADAAGKKEEYEHRVFPWQERVKQSMLDAGLMSCRYPSGAEDGVGAGIKLTLMKDPWPEIDINVAGVDKGKALSRFLQHPDVLRQLGVANIDPAKHVAVFGDAANDVPMFQQVGGVLPTLRVAMPHADNAELIECSNMRAEVADVLSQICLARG